MFQRFDVSSFSYLFVFLCFALFLLPNILVGQYFSIGTDPASTRWNQVKTSHFKIIFPNYLDSQALYIANAFEHFREPGMASLNVSTKKWPVILHSQSVLSNALVPYAPKRIEFINTPPQDNYPQSWIDQLVLHEFRHTVQYTSINRGLTKALSFLIGEQAVPGVIGLFVPLWFIEGDAVAIETATSLSGRGRMPSFEMKLRAQFLEKGVFSYDKAVNGSYRDFIPDRYELGYQLVGRTRVKYGEETWSKVLDKTGKIPLMIVPFSNTLYKETGYGKKRLYDHITAGMKQEWDSIDNLSFHSSFTQILDNKDKFYTSRTQPEILSDGRITAVKRSIDDITRLMIIDTAGNESVLLNPGSMPDEILSASGMLLCWAQLDRDPRWSLRDYSVIMLHNLVSGKTRQLTHKTRYFAPALSPDGSMIATVGIDLMNRCSLVILNAANGEVIHNHPAPENYFLSYPAWCPDEKNIAVILAKNEGKALALANAQNGEFNIVMDFSNVEISKPACFDNYILFTGGYTGNDNIFAFDIVTKTLHQVTSSRFGATDACVIRDGSEMLYSDYTASGYRVASIPLNPSTWTVWDPADNHRWILADSLAVQENFIFLSENVPDSTYAIKPYRKWQHLFNFHSWAPLSVDVDNIEEVNPGVTILSQNLLGTSYSTLGYSYDMNEETGRYSLKYSYEGFYPVIDLKTDYGLRRGVYFDKTDSINISYKYNELNLSAGLRVPLNWNIRSWYIGFQPFAGYTLQLLKMVPGTELKFRHDRIHSLDYNLYFYAQSRQSARDLQPKWGQLLELNYRHSPFEDDTANTIFSVEGLFYLPGFVKHHGFRLYAGYQDRFVDWYAYSGLIRVPRGYSGIYADGAFSASAGYVLPLACPEWSLGPVLYLKRIKAGLFYDLMLNLDVPSEEYYQSVGMDITVDFHLFRNFVPLEAGLRTIYLPDQSQFAFEFLYSVNIDDLY